MRDILLGAALLLGAGALVVALSSESAPVATNSAAPQPNASQDSRALRSELERQQRRINVLENSVADLEDQLSALRGRSAPAATATAIIPSEPPPETAAAVFLPTVSSDGGTPPLLQAAVAEAIRAEKDRERDERQQQRARQQLRWLEETKTRLNLSSEQRDRIKDVVDWVDQRRTELGKQMASGDIPRSQMRTIFEDNRAAYNTRIKEVLTPAQVEEWDTMDESDRRPPFGRGFRGGDGPGP